MPKTFYTDRDIEDLAKRGIISLVEDDDVVLTDLARDKALRLGIELIRENERPPSAPERPYITKFVSPSAEPSAGIVPPPFRTAPVRPYITEAISPSAMETEESGSRLPEKALSPSVSRKPAASDQLFQDVRAAVVAQLGDTVEPKLLDSIIRRVLQNIGSLQG
ncbi:unnamed protein product [marine sediment metagenome]|uniref:Uncharacterized protein n=1 Tax=marine sediment metagenome TaxID=412755 RepID=X0U352_9ZZZZ